jgi:hypothetical protein
MRRGATAPAAALLLLGLLAAPAAAAGVADAGHPARARVLSLAEEKLVRSCMALP